MAARACRRVVALLEDMSPTAMTDTGMWVWAGVVAVVSLAASYAIAAWWQRRRSQSKNEG